MLSHFSKFSLSYQWGNDNIRVLTSVTKYEFSNRYDVFFLTTVHDFIENFQELGLKYNSPSIISPASKFLECKTV